MIGDEEGDQQVSANSRLHYDRIALTFTIFRQSNRKNLVHNHRSTSNNSLFLKNKNNNFLKNKRVLYEFRFNLKSPQRKRLQILCLM